MTNVLPRLKVRIVLKSELLWLSENVQKVCQKLGGQSIARYPVWSNCSWFCQDPAMLGLPCYAQKYMTKLPGDPKKVYLFLKIQGKIEHKNEIFGHIHDYLSSFRQFLTPLPRKHVQMY